VALVQAPAAPDTSPIVVIGYDPRWPALFEQLAGPVRAAVAGLEADVEHVGSTSVPGLPAKPVLDIDVVLRADADVGPAIERLRSVGYVHQGDKGIPGREAFLWPDRAPRHHLYTVVAGNQAHRDHIDFRDYLRSHGDSAREYGELKARLAVEHRLDRIGYTAAKAAFISRVLADARRAGP
jgi:GrpB-like predicted nucleotidyltransferase (UPF0157 family)